MLRRSFLNTSWPKLVLLCATLSISLPNVSVCDGAVNSLGHDKTNAEPAKDGLALLQETTNTKLFTTRTHLALANNLMGKTRRLAAGEYIGHNRTPARLIQGPRGVGKSTVLTTFATQCPKLFRDVSPVYVSFDDLENPQTLLRSKTVLQVVEDQTVGERHPFAQAQD